MQNFSLDYIKKQNDLFFRNARFHDHETYKITNKKGVDLFIVTYVMSFSDGSTTKNEATYKIGGNGHLDFLSSRVLKTTPPL